MQVVHERCCGLDIHKKTVVACVLIDEGTGKVRKHVRTFSTMTADLVALADWLSSLHVTEVALESTGIFVRRITARAIPPARRTGAGGHPWVND